MAVFALALVVSVGETPVWAQETGDQAGTTKPVELFGDGQPEGSPQADTPRIEIEPSSASPAPTADKKEGVSAPVPKDAKRLVQSAATRLLGNRPGEAIAICAKGLEKGITACHRILGAAYQKQGKLAEACAHYAAYLATKPKDAQRVERAVERLRCGP